MSLLWRVFAVNAAVLVVATLALAVSPATVSFPLALTEAIVLTVGLFALIVVNFLLLHRVMRPLERLHAPDAEGRSAAAAKSAAGRRRLSRAGRAGAARERSPALIEDARELGR